MPERRLELAVVGLLALLAWETFAPFLPLFKDSWRSRLRHGLRNLTLALLNTLMTATLFTGLWTFTAQWSESRGFGLLRGLGHQPWLHAPGAIMLLDAWTYGWHRMNHRLPFLWRFHRTHHSDAQMDVTTASRFHFGEIFFSHCLRIPLIALIGMRLWEVALYETLLLAVIQFHHANVGLPGWLDRGLRCFIVTPAMHKVHHSRLQPETDSNYSSLLSVWDRLFQSFRMRDDPRTIRFGLEGWDSGDRQNLGGLVKTPLVAEGMRRLGER